MFHACQKDGRIAFPDMVKGYLCLHRCGLSDDQRAVVLGRTGGKNEIASIAPALRSCFPEYRVPKLNRRSHGVFVSEMPIEEEEIDEDASIDGLINEDDESDFTLDEDEVREVLAAAWKQKTTRSFKRETSSRVWKAVEIDGDFHNEELPRESGRAEIENEVQSMWTCGRECPQKSSQGHKGGGTRSQSWKKNEQFPKKTEREAYFCDWRQLKLERNRVCGEFETLLDSCPGKRLSTLAVQR